MILFDRVMVLPVVGGGGMLISLTIAAASDASSGTGAGAAMTKLANKAAEQSEKRIFLDEGWNDCAGQED